MIPRSQSGTGVFKMQTNSINPQTILYNSDPIMENYFLSAVGSKSDDLILEKSSENIAEMNRHIWRRLKLNEQNA